MEESPKKFSREVRKRTNSIIENWDDGFSDPEIVASKYRSFKKILTHYGIDVEKAKVLEIGSGNAVFLNYMKTQGVNAVGVDVRHRGKNNESQIIARLEQLPFKDGSFEVICSEGTLDSSTYNQDQSLIIQEVARVLKKGGIYFGLENLNISDIKSIGGFSRLPLSNAGLNLYRKS